MREAFSCWLCWKLLWFTCIIFLASFYVISQCATYTIGKNSILHLNIFTLSIIFFLLILPTFWFLTHQYDDTTLVFIYQSIKAILHWILIILAMFSDFFCCCCRVKKKSPPHCSANDNEWMIDHHNWLNDCLKVDLRYLPFVFRIPFFVIMVMHPLL